ncbi:MAG TPA: VTT domain-containing protein [Phycisphaerales bacterium]|nr:VTT domain-containing protein [Phycisphaerales bacterium]
MATPRTFSEWIDRLGLTAVLAAGALVLPPLGSLVLFWKIVPVSEWLRSHGDMGVVVYAVAFALLAGCALLPTYAQSAVGGYAFGVAWGIPAALAGFVGGAVIGYLIAGRVSGDRVERIVEENPKWRAIRDALVGMRGAKSSAWRTTGMVILLRLPPNSPFALTNLVLASVKVPLLPFAAGTLIGMAPRTTLAVVLGAGIEQALTKDTLKAAAPPWLWGVGIAVTMLVVIAIGIIANKAVARATRGARSAGPAPAPGGGA